MKSKRNAKNDKSNAVWLLLISTSFVTLYFNARLQDPFNTSKLIILLISATWLSGHIIVDSRKNQPKIKSSGTTTLFICILFILSLLIALILTDDIIVGLVGDNQRRLGFLAYLGLTVILLFASQNMNFNYSLRLIKTALFVGIVSSSYGIIQMFGRDPIAWNNPYNSIITTLGNPNFASSLMSILSLLALFSLFIREFPIFLKLISMVTVITSLVAIYKSQSRQGLLVFFFGTVFYFMLYIFINGKRKNKLLLGLVTVPLYFVISGMLNAGPLSSFLYKDSVSVRGFYWRAAFEMFKSQPTFGIGLDSYGSYFKEFREVEYPLRYGFDLTSSNAHNVFLQLFSTGGIFVGITYLILLVYVFYSGMKLVGRLQGDKQKIALALFATWIGFQAQTFVSIDNLGLTIWGWLIGGSIIGLANGTEKAEKILETHKSTAKLNKSIEINIVQPLVSTILLIPVIFVSYYLYQGESDAFSLRSWGGNSENIEVIRKYVEEIESNPIADPYYKFQSALSLSDVGYYSEAYEKVSKLLKNDERNLNYLEWSAIYEQDAKNYQKAINLRKQIAKYDPWNGDNYLALGKLYGAIGENDNKQKALDKILSFADKNEIANEAMLELS